jgi:hypothetical protein
MMTCTAHGNAAPMSSVGTSIAPTASATCTKSTKAGESENPSALTTASGNHPNAGKIPSAATPAPSCSRPKAAGPSGRAPNRREKIALPRARPSKNASSIAVNA